MKQKRIRLFILTAVLSAMMVTGSMAVKVKTTTKVNLRQKASSSAEVLTSVPKGTVRTVKKSTKNWYQIKYNGYTGYIHKNRAEETTESVTSLTANESGTQTESFGDKVVTEVKKHLGKSYVYGATGPNSFDCSGLSQYVYRQCGKSIPRVASDQYYASKKISKSDLQKGDLVFFSGSSGGSSVGHVGIYIGDNKMIHAANSRVGVVTTSLSDSYYVSHYLGSGRY